jgi:hypothetical protein
MKIIRFGFLQIGIRKSKLGFRFSFSWRKGNKGKVWSVKPGLQKSVDTEWNDSYSRGMSTTTVAYVTTEDAQDEPHYVLPDGVTVLPNGALMLTYSRDNKGNLQEGHIYGPGCWKEVNVQQEDV